MGKGSWIPSNTWSFDLTPPSTPDGVSTESAIFAKYMLIISGENDRLTSRQNEWETWPLPIASSLAMQLKKYEVPVIVLFVLAFQ